MRFDRPVVGGIPDMIDNTTNLYEGNLRYYFQILFFEAKNVLNPGHNFRHMNHVGWMTYTACKYYARYRKFTPRQMRTLIIAALFHDFNHFGKKINDKINITEALRALKERLLPEDQPYWSEIERLVWSTEHPYTSPSKDLPLDAKILRDADMSQVLEVAWIQQIVFGFAAEWGDEPIEVLRKQIPFLENLRFYSSWGQRRYPQSAIDAKKAESKWLLAILEADVGRTPVTVS